MKNEGPSAEVEAKIIKMSATVWRCVDTWEENDLSILSKGKMTQNTILSAPKMQDPVYFLTCQTTGGGMCKYNIGKYYSYN